MPGDQPTKKQHFVPQWYLRRFSPDGAQVWMFDKLVGVSRHVGLREQCQDRFFYEVANILPGDEYPTNWLEHQLASLDGQVSAALDEVLSADVGSTFDQESCKHLVQALWLQFTRVPKLRQVIVQNVAGQIPVLLARLRRDDETLAEALEPLLGVTLSPQHASYWHGIGLLHDYTWDAAQRLQGYSLAVLHSSASAPFAASDCPVVYTRYRPDPEGRLVRLDFCTAEDRLDQPGAMVFYPISPERCIALFEPGVHHCFWERHGAVADVGPELVEFANALQLQQCERFVVSREDSQPWATALLDKYPALGEPHHISASD